MQSYGGENAMRCTELLGQFDYSFGGWYIYAYREYCTHTYFGSTIQHCETLLVGVAI
jgi:hypothetical protein